MHAGFRGNTSSCARITHDSTHRRAANVPSATANNFNKSFRETMGRKIRRWRLGDSRNWNGTSAHRPTGTPRESDAARRWLACRRHAHGGTHNGRAGNTGSKWNKDTRTWESGGSGSRKKWAKVQTRRYRTAGGAAKISSSATRSWIQDLCGDVGTDRERRGDALQQSRQPLHARMA